MFDLRELKLMFFDPTDLIINDINKFLTVIKQLNLFFLRKQSSYLFLLYRPFLF